MLIVEFWIWDAKSKKAQIFRYSVTEPPEYRLLGSGLSLEGAVVMRMQILFFCEKQFGLHSLRTG